MASDERPDRKAYLDEQIRRKERGEPIDVEWVRAELERVKNESQTRLAGSERRLRWLVVGMAALMCVLWIGGNVARDGDPRMLAPLVVVVALGGWALYRQRRR